MKAIVNQAYGPPEDLTLQEVARPAVEDDTVLVRVRAASVNPLDWHLMRGSPFVVRLAQGLRRPKRSVPGVDVAGEVEAIGANVTEFRPGDEVFGSGAGSFAEYVCGRESNLAPKPAGLTFEQAAAIPAAGITALQALRDHGRLESGQRLAINGAAGGVGTFAVQIAKAFGANVTAVCSTRNLDLVRAIGADAVVDYTVEDFTRNAQPYDLIVDLVGNRSLSDLRRALTPNGTLILAGGGVPGHSFKPLALALRAVVLSRFVSQRLAFFVANVTKDDLITLTGLVDAGKVTPVVDRTYPLSETPDAIRYLETGHARAKTAITV
jgi:NADPH:quinone reductase-like Zn-dependent oxidoreductase